MIAMFRRAYDRFSGSGDYALSVPGLDGAFRPNSALDSAALLAEVSRPDNLVTVDERLLLSSGKALLSVADTGAVPAFVGERDITAMAGAPDGTLAIALGGGDIVRWRPDGRPSPLATPEPGSEVTALCPASDGSLIACIGARGRGASDWRLDLMTLGRSGSVWQIGVDGACRQLASGLAYPAGVAETPEGSFAVTLAWDHAIVEIGEGGVRRTLLDTLPGYPWRIIALSGGGFAMSLLSRRNQLIEFVLREDAYRRRMVDEIEPDYWISPQVAPPTSPLAVMLEGAQRIRGEMKPWAPSQSYGLVVRLGDDFLPQRSWHSRANGYRHGINSLAECDGRLFVTSSGAGAVLELSDIGGKDDL